MSDETGAEPGGEGQGFRATFWSVPWTVRVLIFLGIMFIFVTIMRALTPKPVVHGRMPEPLNDASDVDEPIVIVVARSDFNRAVHDIADRHASNGRGRTTRPRTRAPKAEEPTK